METILGKLEKGDLPIEEQLKLFETGVAESRSCLDKLEAIENRVHQLVVDAKGNFEVSPFAAPNQVDSK